MGMWDWDGWHMGGPEWLFWLIAVAAQILFWGAIVFLVIQLLRRRPSHEHHSRSSALRILEERYARGEIDRDEYLERRSVLERAPRA